MQRRDARDREAGPPERLIRVTSPSGNVQTYRLTLADAYPLLQAEVLIREFEDQLHQDGGES